MVGWGFIYYLLVNLGDTLQAWIPGYQFLGDGTLAGLYRLGADLLSVAVLLGMLGLLIRRFLSGSRELAIRPSTPLFTGVRKGIRRDSVIVGAFILLHVGGRFLGETFHLAGRIAGISGFGDGAVVEVPKVTLPTVGIGGLTRCGLSLT